MTEYKQKKRELRKHMLALRSEIPIEEREKADRQIGIQTQLLPEYENARTVFVYVSVGDEVDTHALIEDAWSRKKRVCVPRCESLGVMHAFEIRSMDDLKAGAYGIPEPKDTCVFVAQNEIDLNIVPCVCCSEEGYRLGYGGGFYDRWLESSQAPSVLRCFDELIIPTVPREEHDRRVDILISETRCRRLPKE